MKKIGFAVLLAICAQPVLGVELGKALQRPVDRTFISDKTIFEVERCIILLDARAIPIVYRQPDRPNYEIIAYSAGNLSVTLILELTESEGKTTIASRPDKAFTTGVLSKLPAGFEQCL